MRRAKYRVESCTPAKPVGVFVRYPDKNNPDGSNSDEDYINHGAAIEYLEDDYAAAVKEAATASDGITRIVEMRMIMKAAIVEPVQSPRPSKPRKS